MNETKAYREIGLETLDIEGKILIQKFTGDHLSLTFDELVDILSPILKL